MNKTGTRTLGVMRTLHSKIKWTQLTWEKHHNWPCLILIHSYKRSSQLWGFRNQDMTYMRELLSCWLRSLSMYSYVSASSQWQQSTLLILQVGPVDSRKFSNQKWLSFSSSSFLSLSSKDMRAEQTLRLKFSRGQIYFRRSRKKRRDTLLKIKSLQKYQPSDPWQWSWRPWKPVILICPISQFRTIWKIWMEMRVPLWRMTTIEFMLQNNKSSNSIFTGWT